MEPGKITFASRFCSLKETVTVYLWQDKLVGLSLGECYRPKLEKRLTAHLGSVPAEGAFPEKLWGELQEYLAGVRQSFDYPLQLHGTPFQLAVWQALLAVPYGTRISYQALGEAAGVRGCRAVGTAVGTNPIALLVPCHRVLPQSGGVGNYSGGQGAPTKQALLRLEGIFA